MNNNCDCTIKVDGHWLPSQDTIFFFDSTFFKNHTISSLPSTAEIKAATGSGGERLISRFPSLSLLVKRVLPFKVFRSTTIIPAPIAEGQVLWALPRLLPQIRVPEVYGWRRRDDGGLYIFMELVDGENLRDMWPTLSEEEKEQLCGEAGTMVRALRRLARLTGETFIGALSGLSINYFYLNSPLSGTMGGQPLNDRVFQRRVVETFPNADAFYEYLTQMEPYMREIMDPEYPEFSLPYNDPFVFTHADLALCNIMVTRRQPNVPLRIAAIIDWEQSGWLPLSWEPYKARASEESDEKIRYLATITGDIDDDVYLALDTFVMSLGGF
ncbi:hypothetical protein C0989_005056 [Termitomyces sp. Mn162]|nr:hypothetical protein C0989_005056 [Termitomyces sp. Mn162]